MIVLSAQNVAKAFGINVVLKDVSFTVQQGDRIGLVGVNGCGKSTLMRIIAGLDSPDSGEISIVRGTRIGYLAQQDMVTSGASVWAELEKVYEPVFEMEKRLRVLESEMEHAHTDAALFARLSSDYDKLMSRFEEADGYAWKSMVSGVLNGLGFSPAQYEQNVDSLSGGEKTRLCLARLLLQKPDLLLLDEPTNHLDISSREAIEQALLEYEGTLFIVSHDRYFINRLADRLYYMDENGITEYIGNYDDFEASRPAAEAAKPQQQKQKSSQANDYKLRKERESAARKRKTQIERAEAELERISEEMQQLNAELSLPETASSYERILELTGKLNDLTDRETELYILLEELCDADQ